jgi:hypothetical protein
MTQIVGGKIFYSNSQEYLQGVADGADYVNDGPIVVHEITTSDKPGYTFMLALEDTDDDTVTSEFF